MSSLLRGRATTSSQETTYWSLSDRSPYKFPAYWPYWVWRSGVRIRCSTSSGFDAVQRWLWGIHRKKWSHTIRNRFDDNDTEYSQKHFQFVVGLWDIIVVGEWNDVARQWNDGVSEWGKLSWGVILRLRQPWMFVVIQVMHCMFLLCWSMWCSCFGATFWDLVVGLCYDLCSHNQFLVWSRWCHCRKCFYVQLMPRMVICDSST